MEELNKLLSELIQIPSWVDYQDDPSIQNENKLVDFLFNWIKKNTNMEVDRQILPGKRMNLICKKGRPDIVFLGHTDTVAPSINATYDQGKATIVEDKIFGRGATDMKSGIAAILQASKNNPDADNYWIFLYADEEYGFLGMKNLVEKYGGLRPRYLVSADGSDLKMRNGCRGLIELTIRIRGKSGHAARDNGINAITGALNGYKKLEKYLKDNNSQNAKSSINLAYLMGGSDMGEKSWSNGCLTSVGKAGNVIPDVAEMIIDIRPASPKIRANTVIKVLEKFYRGTDYKMEVVKVTHDLGAWLTEEALLKPFIKIAEDVTDDGIKMDDINLSGYFDLQMFWEATGKPISLVFGGGEGVTAHSPDESIKISSLKKTADFFDQVLKKLTN